MGADEERENGTYIENYADRLKSWGPDLTPTTINGVPYVVVPEGYLTTENFYGGQHGLDSVLQQAMSTVIKDPQTGASMMPLSAYQYTQSAMQPYARQDSGFDKFLESVFSAGPLLMGGAVVGGGLSGLFDGLTAGAAGGAGALPESYWSMLAESGGAGTPSAAAGTFGGLTGDALGLAQMGQAAGLSGSALDAFIASGGTMGSTAGGGSLANSLMNLFTPSPTSLATTTAGQILNGGNVDTGNWWDKIVNAGSSLLGNKNLLTALGGVGGYLSGTKPTESTAQSDYPDWLKPYISSGLGAGLAQLNASKDLTPGEQSTIAKMLQGLSTPNAGLDAANQAMTDTASGKYLDLENNPQWQEMMRLLGQNYNETIRPGTDAAFSRAGAMGIGNSAWEEMTARNNRALATGQGAATANVWGQERDKQMNAAGAMPGFQNQYLTGLGNSALQLGNYQRTQPWQGILNYGQLMGSLKGPMTQTQSTSANPWQTAAGGALTGYSLSNLWK